MSAENGISHGANVAEILERNAKRFGVELHELTGRRRFMAVSRAKAITQLEMREHLGMTYIDIGRFFGLDHSTVISNVRKAKKTIETEGQVVFDNPNPFEPNTILPTAIDENIKSFLNDNFPDILIDDVKGVSRAHRIAIPRQSVVRYLYENGVYLSLIADKLNRDHSSVIHAINKPDEKMEAEVKKWKFLEEKTVKQAKRKRRTRAIKTEN